METPGSKEKPDLARYLSASRAKASMASDGQLKPGIASGLAHVPGAPSVLDLARRGTNCAKARIVPILVVFRFHECQRVLIAVGRREHDAMREMSARNAQA